MQYIPLQSWPEMEAQFAKLSHRVLVGFAVRGAQRVLPIIAEGSADYGPEAIEWLMAIHAALEAPARFASGEKISRFTLDLAAEMARGTANSAANVVRIMGHAKSAEDAELVFAAVAFAADCARSSPMSRAANAAMKGLRAADALGRISQQLWELDWQQTQSGAYETLWPTSEPQWYTEGIQKLMIQNAICYRLTSSSNPG